MHSSQTYESAIELLNTVQTNASVLEQISKSRGTMNQRSLPEMREFLREMGYKPSDFDQLKAIHIAGTKGKGSTVAFVDSILRKIHIQDPKTGRSRALRTATYTSPHLIEVRERIRINGEPISRQEFAHYFFECWHKFKTHKPTYFRFLTLMAFHIFTQLKQSNQLDCAIIEVGIGGEFDATNVLERPIVTGISSLGYDHQSVLGYTLPEIAWHKAGIMKPGVLAVTTQQESEALDVIVKRAKEIGTSCLQLVSNDERVLECLPELGLKGKHQRHNALLAITIVQEWVQKLSTTYKFSNISSETVTPCQTLYPATKPSTPIQNGRVHMLPEPIVQGLKDVRWPGRAQIYTTECVQWCLEGAHTPESMIVCAEWFKSAVTNTLESPRILVFNCTMGRDATELLTPLVHFHTQHAFTQIIFCRNITSKSDLKNNMVNLDKELVTQQKLKHAWERLVKERQGIEADVSVVSSIPEMVERCNTVKCDDKKPFVLVTGSLHLVGGVLASLGAEVQ